MKKISTLTLCLLQSILMMAAEPTVPSSNFVFSNVDGTRFTIRYTSGNGTNRIVVLKAGSAITGQPVNGAEYTANSVFGTAGTNFTAANEYVVYKGNGNSFIVSNLNPATTYYLSVFEYNGSSTTTQYLLLSLNGSQATVSAPVTQTNSFTYSNKSGNSIKVSWNNGSGEGRLVLARKATAVNAEPEDLHDYTASSDFGAGNALNTDNYVLYKATANTVTIANLEPNTTYHLAYFERNGSSAPMYLRPGAVTNFTTNAGPTVPTQSFQFSNQEGNRFTVNTSRGNGSRRLYIVRKAAPVTAAPVSGQVYNANAAFGSGEEIAPGEFIVYNSTESSFILTNLEPGTVYYIKSFEYDMDAAGNSYYLLTNPASGNYSTATPPNPVTNVNFTNVTGNSISIRYTSGNGGYRMVLMKESAPVNGVPQNLIRYNGNSVFGNGDVLPTGNYVVNGGANGTITNVSNLKPGFTYHVAVYEFSGNNFPIYGPVTTASVTLPAEPTNISTSFTKTQIEGNSFRANWVNGSGTNRLVIARKNSAVTAVPVDGTTYTANSNFGSGTAILADQYVVYDGPNGTCDLKNLEIGSNYHIAVFEYNSPGGNPDYLTSNWLSGNATTLSSPATQTSTISTTAITDNSATIGFASGNGTSRIFIMRAVNPVNAEPVDLTVYSASTIYGLQEIGTGNYVVQKATGNSNFTVSGLAPNTTYHIAAFECNGITGPVYKRPGAVATFTTTAGSVIVAPTVPATAPLYTGIDGNKLTLKFTEGNGSNRIVIARAGSAVTSVPVNGTSYVADANFGSGTEIAGNEFVVMNVNGNSVTINNLNHSTTYHFAVFEYNGTGSNTRYLTSTFLSTTVSTVASPVSGATNANKSATSSTATISWQNGTGTGRVVIMREGAPVTGSPVNLSTYPASAVFGTGAQVGANEFVVYAGSGNSVNVTGLIANKSYYFSIVEFNGNTGPVYNTVNSLTGNLTTSVSLPVTWLYFNANESNNQAFLKWGTATEQNTDYFVIEKNAGTGFISIDTIIAAGNSVTDKHYTYTDKKFLNATTLYRLKQVDKDGRFIYSAVATIQFQSGNKLISFYPNPATQFIRFNLPVRTQSTQLKIYDAKGSLVLQQVLTNNLQDVDVSKLKTGIYYITLENGELKYSEKLIKQ